MNDFFKNTKKTFKSCKFACTNMCGPRSDWNVWGDFKVRNQAIDAAIIWASSFGGKVSPIEIVDGCYRASVSMVAA